MDDSLRESLIKLIKRKFRGYPNVNLFSDDIVQEAYLRLKSSRGYAPDKENFGYLSVVCVRLAYRQFMSRSKELGELILDIPDMTLVSEDDVAAELLAAEDTRIILNSLKTLREIERIVVTQRYYGNFSFAEIAKRNGLNLNTVLSHHRRALAKLRPQLTKFLGYGEEQRYEQDTLEIRPHR